MFILRLFNPKKLFLITLVFCTLTLYLSAAPVLAVQSDAESVPASELDATPAVQWIQLLYERIFAESINPAAAARLYAYGGITLYEAALPGMPGYLPLSGQLTDMPDMPAVEEGLVYDWLSSVAGAMSVVLPDILPENPETLDAVNLLRERQTTARLRDVPEDVVERSLAYGESVGNAILEWESQDFAKEAQELAQDFVLPTGEVDGYQLTTPGTKPTEPYWGMVRPFGIPSSSACDMELDMEFNTDPTSTFYLQSLEVKTVGDRLTPEQKDIVLFWVDTPGITGTPAGHWMLIAAQVVSQLDLKLDRATEAFAMVGVAVGDAFISGWNTKYKIMLIRPETYIQRYIDERWQPFVQTPPFPEFISGHSIVSQSAATTLTYLFGTQAFTDDSERFRGLARRSFVSFQQAASEAAISRLYGGIHYRTGVEKGLDQGRCVGDFIHQRVHLHDESM